MYRLKNILVILALLAVNVFSMSFFAPACQAAPQKVKVGFFPIPQYQGIDDFGKHTGIGYEYLQKIAQYADIECEFVRGSWPECLKMLEEGKIDMISGVSYLPELAERIDYAKFGNSIIYATLYTNREIAYEDFPIFDGLKIGILVSDVQRNALAEYARQHNFNYQPIEFSDADAANRAMNNGAIDAILRSSFGQVKDYRTIAKFNPAPLFLAVSKGRPKLLNTINAALDQLKINEPLFELRLYDKYKTGVNINFPVFSKDEQDYINEKGVLFCAYDPNWLPLEYTDPQTGVYTGISADIIQLLARYTGLEIRPATTTSFSESVEKVQSGEADILASFFADDDWARRSNLKISRPYLSNNIVALSRKDTVTTDKIGLIKDYYLSFRVSSETPPDKIRYYDSVVESLEGLRKTEVDQIYTNSLIAAYFLSNPRYASLFTTNLTKFKEEIAIAIRSDSDPRLMSIINKTLQCVSDQKLNQILLTHTTKSMPLSMTDVFYAKPLDFIYSISVLSLLIIAVLLYIIALKNKANNRITNLLYYDSLTGMSNYKKFQQDAAMLLEKNVGEKYSLIYIDIEKFKYINDTYGYEIGDKVLLTVAKHLTQAISQKERVGRIFADDFVLLLHYTDNDNLVSRVLLLEQHLEALIDDLGIGCRVVFRSGVYYLQPDETDIYRALDKANFAKDSSKGAYANTCIVYNDEIRNVISQEKELNSMMKTALINNEFFPCYQPKVNVFTRKIIGAEALVRWHQPQKGMILPSDFIPYFERNGFVKHVDLYIFETVCRQIKQWSDVGYRTVPIACNFSRLHFNEDGFAGKLKAITDKYGVDPHLMELEITETVAMERNELMSRQVNELRELGFAIAIDDFGSGYSSLGLLQDMKIDVLKLDTAFVQKGLLNRQNKFILSGLIDMVHKMHIKVICEGIETTEMEDLIKFLGCQLAQGYLYFRPIPADEFEQLLEQSTTE